jgi:hypothetical protein
MFPSFAHRGLSCSLAKSNSGDKRWNQRGRVIVQTDSKAEGDMRNFYQLHKRKKKKIVISRDQNSGRNQNMRIVRDIFDIVEK